MDYICAVDCICSVMACSVRAIWLCMTLYMQAHTNCTMLIRLSVWLPLVLLSFTQLPTKTHAELAHQRTLPKKKRIEPVYLGEII